jgi:pimeloyl-ACP methyl ester carboxylesterase
MTDTTRIFLPGAGGSAGFWQPVADRLPAAWPKVLLSWPGLGDQPHDPRVNSLDDLVDLVGARIEAADGPVDLIGQSMGGLITIRAALRHPDRIRRIVLTGTSGGVDVAGLGGADWRADYRRDFPNAAGWITETRADHTTDLGAITVPVLLLWGDADPVSPLAVAHHLAERLPHAMLAIVPGGDHAFPFRMADRAAPPIARHLG